VPRPQLHSADGILDAARDLVLEGGARAATLDGVIVRSGAPKGSIYHRFETLNDLLATMWLRAVRRSQAAFLDALGGDDPVEAAVAAALAIHDFAVRDPPDARLLAALRREDLLGTVANAELAQALQDVNGALARGVRDLARRLYDDESRRAVEWATCAVIDLPQGAIRRHLIGGATLPADLRAQLEAAVRAALPVSAAEPGRN
jgi:AcrR family transcriptional regulator